MNYFVYIYFLNKKIVYVGKTCDLDKRIKEHCKETAFYGLCDISYFICSNKTEMDSLEGFLIFKYKPFLNKTKPNFTIELIQFENLKLQKYTKNISFPKPLINKDFPLPIYDIKPVSCFEADGNFSFTTYEIGGNTYVKLQEVQEYSSMVWHAVNNELTEKYNKHFKIN